MVPLPKTLSFLSIEPPAGSFLPTPNTLLPTRSNLEWCTVRLSPPSFFPYPPTHIVQQPPIYLPTHPPTHLLQKTGFGFFGATWKVDEWKLDIAGVKQLDLTHFVAPEQPLQIMARIRGGGGGGGEGEGGEVRVFLFCPPNLSSIHPTPTHSSSTHPSTDPPTHPPQDKGEYIWALDVYNARAVGLREKKKEEEEEVGKEEEEEGETAVVAAGGGGGGGGGGGKEEKKPGKFMGMFKRKSGSG